MNIPLGLTVESTLIDPPLACKLKKSLYGLKQTSRQWFAKLSQSLMSRGYSPSKNDSSLFTKITDLSIVLLAVYIDDLLLDSKDDAKMVNLKSFLDHQFKIKDLGSVHYFLGFEVTKID